MLYLTKLYTMFTKSMNSRGIYLFKTSNLLISTTKIKTPQKTNRQWIFFREKSFFRFAKDTISKIKEKDNVPEAFQLIYRNRMSNYLLAAQIISTVGAGIICLALITSNEIQNVELKKGQWQKKADQVSKEVYVFLTVFLGVCVLLQLHISRMPLRVYNHPKQDEYIMIFYAALPTITKRITYRATEVSKQPSSAIIPWKDSTYKVKNKGRIILLENFFRTPADLNIMLGYQKQPKDGDEIL